MEKDQTYLQELSRHGCSATSLRTKSKKLDLNNVSIKNDNSNDNLCKIAIPHTKNGCTYIEYITKDLLIKIL